MNTFERRLLRSRHRVPFVTSTPSCLRLVLRLRYDATGVFPTYALSSTPRGSPSCPRSSWPARAPPPVPGASPCTASRRQTPRTRARTASRTRRTRTRTPRGRRRRPTADRREPVPPPLEQLATREGEARGDLALFRSSQRMAKAPHHSVASAHQVELSLAPSCATAYRPRNARRTAALLRPLSTCSCASTTALTTDARAPRFSPPRDPTASRARGRGTRGTGGWLGRGRPWRRTRKPRG